MQIPGHNGKDNTMASQPLVIEPRTEKLDVLFSRSTKAKLQFAAAIAHRTMSEYVIESSLSKADDTIAKERHCFDCGKLRCDCF
jgi:uncharacterized protein (DUF1778 family)